MGFLRFGQVYTDFYNYLLKRAIYLVMKFFRSFCEGCFALFIAETEQGVALAILRGVIDFKREPWPQISESAKSLVRQMLEPDPKKRLTAQQVLGESFVVCYSVGV